jgi:hypothetical protein
MMILETQLDNSPYMILKLNFWIKKDSENNGVVLIKYSLNTYKQKKLKIKIMKKKLLHIKNVIKKLSNLLVLILKVWPIKKSTKCLHKLSTNPKYLQQYLDLYLNHLYLNQLLGLYNNLKLFLLLSHNIENLNPQLINKLKFKHWWCNNYWTDPNSNLNNSLNNNKN